MSRFAGLQGPPLHQAVLETRRQHARSEFELIQALIAVEGTKLHRQMRCATAVDYGSRYLNLEPHKARELLRVGRLLPKFPLLAQVVEEGELHWSKIREITRVITPENEHRLIDYARNHLSHVVQRLVACRPRHARKIAASTGAAASAIGACGAGTAADADGGSPSCAADGSSSVAGAGADSAPGTLPASVASGGAARARLTSASPVAVAAPEQEDLFGQPLPGAQVEEPPVKPQEILYDMRLSVVQWAKQEQVNNRICSRLGFRANRARIQEEMCDICLSVGDVRTQIRYQVYLHVDGITGEGWLDTERGFLPAPREVVAEALARGRVTEVTRESVPGWGWPNRVHVLPASAGEGAAGVGEAAAEVGERLVAGDGVEATGRDEQVARDADEAGPKVRAGVGGEEESVRGHAGPCIAARAGGEGEAAGEEPGANLAGSREAVATGGEQELGDALLEDGSDLAVLARAEEELTGSGSGAVQESVQPSGCERKASAVGPGGTVGPATGAAGGAYPTPDCAEPVSARPDGGWGTGGERNPAGSETTRPLAQDPGRSGTGRPTQEGTDAPGGELRRETPHKRARKKIPVETMRKLLEESEGRCVGCGTRLRVQFNHRDRPYSEAPEHDPSTMDNRCDRCHEVFHLEDFQSRPGWRAARDRAIRARRAQRVSAKEPEDAP